jgi:hypothetical protein
VKKPIDAAKRKLPMKAVSQPAKEAAFKAAMLLIDAHFSK